MFIILRVILRACEKACSALSQWNVAFCVFLLFRVGCAAQKYQLLPDEDSEVQGSVVHMLRGSLEEQTSVWVMVVCNGQRYTGLFDLDGEICGGAWDSPEGKKINLIQPLMDALKHESMQGYKTRRFCKPQTNFRKEFDRVGGALTRWRYKRCAFFSGSIRFFLTSLCPKLLEMGRVSFDGCGKPLTNDVLRSLEPPSGQWLSFIIQNKRQARAEMMSAKAGDPMKVFMTLPDFGVVRGCAAPSEGDSTKEFAMSSQCFFSHKMRVLADYMSGRYSFDKETWKTCINYGRM